MEQNKKISGVTIVEIMVTMVLVAMLLIAIVAIFPTMTGHRKGIHESDQAKILATEALEGLQTLSRYRDPTGPCTNIADVDDFDVFEERFDNPLPIGAVAYQVTWEFTCDGDFNTAAVKVTWDKMGTDHTITVIGAIL